MLQKVTVESAQECTRVRGVRAMNEMKSQRYREARKLGIDLTHEHIPAPRPEALDLDKVSDGEGNGGYAVWERGQVESHIIYNERIEVPVRQ